MDPDTVQVMVRVVAVEEVTLRLFTGSGTAVVGTTIVGVAVPGELMTKQTKTKGSWYRIP